MTTTPDPHVPATDAEWAYADVVLLSRWMAEQGGTAGEVADVVEKPWKYRDWLELARRGEDLPDY